MKAQISGSRKDFSDSQSGRCAHVLHACSALDGFGMNFEKSRVIPSGTAGVPR